MSNVGKTMPSAPSPSHHSYTSGIHINHSQSWVVYDIALPTLNMENHHV